MHIQKKWVRITIYLLSSGVAVILLLWAAVPLWFPWVLRPFANSQNVHWERYERLGYDRAAIYGLGFTNRNVRLQARRLEMLTPTAWLWRVWRPQGEGLFAEVQDWRLDIVRDGKRTDAGTQASVFNTTQDILNLSRTLQKWVPRAGLSNGTVHVSGQVLKLPLVKWSLGRLDAQVESGEHHGTLFADLSRGTSALLQIESGPLETDLRISTTSTGVALQAVSFWQSNRVDLQANFGRTGLLPASATLHATNFHVSLTNLPGYQDVQGSILSEWAEGRFTLSVDANAKPIQTNFPPVELSFNARGDTNFARIGTALIRAPGLRAALASGMNLHYRGQILREPASMELELDLQRMWATPLFTSEALQGVLRGKVDLEPSGKIYPVAQFHLTGSHIGNRELQARTLEAAGRLEWPWLRGVRLNAGFDDGSRVAITGGLQIQQKLIETARVEFDGKWVKRFLPAGYDLENLTLVADANGPLTEPAHQGEVQIANLSSPDLNSTTINARWHGNALNLREVLVKLTSGHSELDLEGSLDLQTSASRLCLRTMSLRSNGVPQLTLSKPGCAWLARPESPGAFSAGTDALHWRGPAGEFSVAAGVVWPTAGNIVLSAQGIRSDLLSSFIKASLPLAQVDTLRLSGQWTNGPARATLSLTGSLLTNFPAVVTVEAIADEAGVTLRRFNVREGSMPLATAEGFIPFVVHPSDRANRFELRGGAPLRLRAIVDPKGSFFERVAGWTGVLLREPHLAAHVEGTWDAPQGEIRFGAKRVELNRPGTLPSVTELELRMIIDRQVAHLKEGRFLVQSQPATLTAKLPLGESFWTGLRKKQLPDWSKAEARLQVQGVEIGAIAELFPEIVAPQGTMTVNLGLLPGRTLDGFVQVENAATRPLPTVGPIREINLKLIFEPGKARLENTTASVGGAALSIAGGADLRETNWHTGSLPPFSVAILGAEIPLSRKAEAIIRSDLNVMVTRTNGAPPIITGVANLRDSYFLSDLGDLVGGGVAGPRRRPPYFSIDKPFLADWRLAAQVTGERFLKIRTPLFTGAASANLSLQGTLKDPIAVGDIRIDSGHVRFPFGSLAVQRGSVTITSENPYQPNLLVLARSKQFGYDIRMEVTGSASAPVIQFSSTPPLGSEQILLLLTAGEIPSGEYTMSPEQRAQTLAMFLGRELLQKLGIGGMGEERLVIRSGEEITESGKPTYRIQFKLSEDWSLIAEYDRFGDFNAGAQWRFYSR